MTSRNLQGERGAARTRGLPSLFGRFTAVQSDHERLRLTLRRLGELCTELERRPDTLDPARSPERLLLELTESLREHFSSEEAGAYFGTIVAEQPSLLPRVEALVAEHVVMLKELDELSRLASDPRDWAKLPAPARRLIARLRAHEHVETQVIQEFFLNDEGTSED